ncbi:MAG: hypothetical protein JKY29_12495 [Gammaproteobacteria bacterium]|nr:hypothetical protein [Gammaproteobacteria bacterium]
MKGKLQEFALVAEIVSAIAVVLSLVYVGYQIQQSTAERRTDSIHSLNAGYRELALTNVLNENLGVAWHKVLDGEELSKRQVDLMSDALYAHLMQLEDTYNRYKEGYIDDDFLVARTNAEIQRITYSPQLLEVYGLMKDAKIYTQSFIDWLDSNIESYPNIEENDT